MELWHIETRCMSPQLGGHLHSWLPIIATYIAISLNENLRGPFQVNDPEEARRIRSKGGKVMDGGSRVVSPSGRHSLNMSRALGDADYKTPRRIVSATPDVRHVTLGCGTAK